MARLAESDPADFSFALASALPTLTPASIEQLVGVFHTAGIDTISEMRLYGTLELIVRVPLCAAAVDNSYERLQNATVGELPFMKLAQRMALVSFFRPPAAHVPAGGGAPAPPAGVSGRRRRKSACDGRHW